MFSVLMTVTCHHLQSFMSGNPLYCRQIESYVRRWFVMSVLTGRYFACSQIDDQKRINMRLVSCDKKIKTLNEDLGKLIKVKSDLMRDLLTGKVPVKLDHEEPAHG